MREWYIKTIEKSPSDHLISLLYSGYHFSPLYLFDPNLNVWGNTISAPIVDSTGTNKFVYAIDFFPFNDHEHKNNYIEFHFYPLEGLGFGFDYFIIE